MAPKCGVCYLLLEHIKEDNHLNKNSKATSIFLIGIQQPTSALTSTQDTHVTQIHMHMAKQFMKRLLTKMGCPIHACKESTQLHRQHTLGLLNKLAAKHIHTNSAAQFFLLWRVLIVSSLAVLCSRRRLFSCSSSALGGSQ